MFKVSASTGETDILATLAGPGIRGAYLHSFFLSEDFAILCIWNSHLVLGGAAILWRMNVLDTISEFDPSTPAKWFVIDRHNGKGLVAEFESPAFFAFHTVNAWQKPRKVDEDAFEIICSVIQYPNLDIMHKFFYENLTSTGSGAEEFNQTKGPSCKPKLSTYSLRDIRMETLDRSNPNRAVSNAELISEVADTGELPIFNQACRLKQLRYLYTVVDRGHSTFFDGLAKVDLETEAIIYWDNPKGHTPSEAIFVANPEAMSEDDGVLLSVVLDGFSGRSYLLCLDAKTMKELGRAQMDCVVSFGFHGQHVNRSGNAVEF